MKEVQKTALKLIVELSGKHHSRPCCLNTQLFDKLKEAFPDSTSTDLTAAMTGLMEKKLIDSQNGWTYFHPGVREYEITSGNDDVDYLLGIGRFGQ